MHTIVVGAGIAGLYVAEQLAKLGDQVTVLEKADYLGGRILTSDLGYEIGAGRLASTHKRVLRLIQRFGLETFPHGSGYAWKGLDSELRPLPNDFDVVWSQIVRLIAKFDAKTLGTHTLRKLTSRILGSQLTDKLLIKFPYRAEMDTMRADLALQSFVGDMSGKTSFVGVKGGLTQIITGLADACRAADVTIRLNTTVTDVVGTIVHTTEGPVPCDRVVLALTSEVLRKFPCMRTFKSLKHLRMEPLTRIYAKFATAWPFKERIVTDSPLRFIIPIVPELGIVMISYTESQDTQAFRGLKGLQLIGALQQALSDLFPDQTMPLMLWAKAYEWTHGCSYWLPGNYDPVAESIKALQPFPRTQPNLYICNESFSLHQAWMEGSLDHAASLLELIKKQKYSEVPNLRTPSFQSVV